MNSLPWHCRPCPWMKWGLWWGVFVGLTRLTALGTLFHIPIKARPPYVAASECLHAHHSWMTSVQLPQHLLTQLHRHNDSRPPQNTVTFHCYLFPLPPEGAYSSGTFAGQPVLAYLMTLLRSGSVRVAVVTCEAWTGSASTWAMLKTIVSS